MPDALGKDWVIQRPLYSLDGLDFRVEKVVVRGLWKDECELSFCR